MKFLPVCHPPHSSPALMQVIDRATKADLPFYYFEIFDADWKRIYLPCFDCARLQVR